MSRLLDLFRSYLLVTKDSLLNILRVTIVIDFFEGILEIIILLIPKGLISQCWILFITESASIVIWVMSVFKMKEMRIATPNHSSVWIYLLLLIYLYTQIIKWVMYKSILIFLFIFKFDIFDVSVDEGLCLGTFALVEISLLDLLSYNMNTSVLLNIWVRIKMVSVRS